MENPSLRARLWRSLHYRGLARTLKVGWELGRYRLRRGRKAPRPHAFDLEFGVDTVSLEFGATVVGEAMPGNGHEPIDTVDFAALLAELAIEHSQFTFMDFGSGQGRALMLAASYPFARIVGIEYARELHACAERNLAIYAAKRFRLQRCSVIESVWADAAQWELPLVPSVFYFCEPFQAPMMQRMIERLRASLAAHPRPAYVLYVGDWHRGLWEAPGEFEELAGHYFDRIYRWQAGGQAAAPDAGA